MGEITIVKRLLATVLACLPVCAFSQEAMESTKTYEMRFETTEHKRYCKASVWVEYSQYDTEARYNGEISAPQRGMSCSSRPILRITARGAEISPL